MQAVYEKVGGRWFPVYKDLQEQGVLDLAAALQVLPGPGHRRALLPYPAPPDPNLMQALGEASQRFVLADMIQAVLVKNQTPEQAIDDAQKTFVEIFKKYKVGQ